MKRFSYKITNPNGFHVRLVGAFVREAEKYPCEITITKGNKSANAHILFSIMALGARCGETIIVTVEGDQEEQAAVALKALIEENL